jgi:hypothetical protein
MQDIADLLGVLMRVVDGAEASVDEVEALTFDCGDDLTPSLNEAFIMLLEFAHDRELRARDRAIDDTSRAGLERMMKRIGRLAETPRGTEGKMSLGWRARAA